MNRHTRLAEIFADTQGLIASTPELREAAERSATLTTLVAADEWPMVAPGEREGTIRVSSRRSLEAARAIARERPGTPIAVHNFASPTTPGGGVRRGSPAQEESLCRCTTLYQALDQRWLWEAYYGPNRAARNALATDDCIWSPGAIVCKSDTEFPARLGPSEWLEVDVITCAAPNLHMRTTGHDGEPTDAQGHIPLSALYALHVRRARHILATAAAQGIRALVTGAFGCGAFGNDPYLVAGAWHEALNEWRSHFDLVEFAVFHMPYESANHEAFSAEFADEEHV